MPERATAGGRLVASPGVGEVHPSLQPLPAPPVLQSSVGRLFESRGETGPPACARETQRVSPSPRVVFVRPIVGHLEDLTTVCLTSFHHSADTFGLNNEDGSLRAVPQLDPPHPCL